MLQATIIFGALAATPAAPAGPLDSNVHGRGLVAPAHARAHDEIAGRGPSPAEPASFDYGGVSRANTGVGEIIPPALRLEPDAEWTVALWVRNMEASRTRAIACAFWGDNAFHPAVAHIFGLFCYFDEAGSADHGNPVAWVHGRAFRLGDLTAPLDDDGWHLVAVRNREQGGSYFCSLSVDGQAWAGEGEAPRVSMTDTTLPWSLNSMHDSRFPVPWVRRRDCKLDELVLFEFALDDGTIKKLYHNGRPWLPDGGGGLYARFESPGETITAHYMFGKEGAPTSSTTVHRSYTDMTDGDLVFVVEGSGAGVIDLVDYPGAR